MVKLQPLLRFLNSFVVFVLSFPYINALGIIER